MDRALEGMSKMQMENQKQNMNATELFLKDGKSAGIFYCEKCRCVAGSQVLAEQCCKNYLCSKCGKDVGSRSWLVCDACRASEETANEREHFEKAEKLTAWDGWVYCNEGTGHEGFSESLSAFYDHWADDHDEGGSLPKYVWACKSHKFVTADFDDIMEHIEENGYEDFDSRTLSGLAELKAALKTFEDANAGVLSYSPDYTKAILLNESSSPTAGCCVD